ncbi:MAG: radical SAM protein [Planctomycetes bacterium]|nr:radical SAM protein [Planctomycetota bacterium]
MLSRPDLAGVARTLRPNAFPSRFAVELCADCNLRCSMCHHPSMRRPKGVMPFPLWQRCADEIAATAPQTQCWFSFCGEPLLQPELLLRCLAYGRSVGLSAQCLNTNGMLLTPDLADALLGAGLGQFVIGLDGFRAETYAKIRVGGDRDVVYGNVEYLLERRRQMAAGPEVMVQFIAMAENEGELPAFRDHWLPRGATVKARHMLSWGGRFGTQLCVPDEERIACPWAVTMLHVFWDGRVPRCPGDTEGDEGVGNAWQESLADLWAKLGRYRELHLQHRFAELPERCQTCRDWMVGRAERIRPGAGGAA